MTEDYIEDTFPSRSSTWVKIFIVIASRKKLISDWRYTDDFTSLVSANLAFSYRKSYWK